MTACGSMRRQAAKVAGRADALVARPAGQALDLHGFCRQRADRAKAPSAPRASARRCRRSASASSPRCAAGRCRRRRRAALRAMSARSSARSTSPNVEHLRRAAPARARVAPPRRCDRRPGDRRGPSSARCAGDRRRRRAPATSAAKDGSGHRRNGLPALTCTTATIVSVIDARGAQPLRDARVGRRDRAASRSDRAPDRPRCRASRRSPQSSSHWLTTECRGCRLARPMHRSRVLPAAALDVVADALRRAGRPRQPRAARSAVQIEDDVETLPRAAVARARRRREAGASRACAEMMITSARCGLPATTGAALALDQVGQPRVRKRPLERPRKRRREDDVADEAKANEQYLHVTGRAPARPSSTI